MEGIKKYKGHNLLTEGLSFARAFSFVVFLPQGVDDPGFWPAEKFWTDTSNDIRVRDSIASFISTSFYNSFNCQSSPVY